MDKFEKLEVEWSNIGDFKSWSLDAVKQPLLLEAEIKYIKSRLHEADVAVTFGDLKDDCIEHLNIPMTYSKDNK